MPSRHIGYRHTAALLTGTLLSMPAAQAAAQVATRDADIVITASKRPERLQVAPVSALVVTSQSLQRNQIRDFDDLARVVPSLTVTKTTQPANNSINIRGVGTYAFSIAARSSVAVVVDDVALGAQAQAFRPLTDVEQVQVLRGPQSTLFGTSASAGAILITTRDPTSTPSGSADFTITSDHEERISGSVSGPLSRTIKVRLSAGESRYRGNLYNRYDGHWVGGYSDQDIRAKVLWLPTSSTAITFAPYWSTMKSTCCTSAYQFVSPGVSFGRFRGFAAPQPAVLAGIKPGTDNRQISADVDPKGSGSDRGMSIRAQRKLGAYTITYLAAFDLYRLVDRQDTDGTSFNWGAGGANVPGAVRGGSANGGFFRFRSRSQEMKLVSPDQGSIRYVAGLYFNSVRSIRDFVRGTNDLRQDGTLSTVPPTSSQFASYVASASATDLAAYGQATISLLPVFDAVGGVRFNHQRISYSLLDRGNQVSFGEPSCSRATPSGLKARTCNSFSAVAGRAALVARPSKQITIFASYDRGYKGAAYDITSTLTMRALVSSGAPYGGFPIADAVAAKQPIAPETVNAFQLGVKSRVFGWLTANATLFDERFHNFQAQSRDDLTRQNVLNSIPKLRTRGAEIELSGNVRPSVSIDIAAAFADARIGKFQNAPCFPSQPVALGCVGGQQNLSGARLFQAPKWSVSATGEYTHQLSSRASAFVTVSTHWQSRIYESLLHDPQSIQKAYGILNLSGGLRAERWTVRAFGINILNRAFALSKGRDSNWNIDPYGLSGAPTDAVRWTPARDSARYVGLELSRSY